MLKKISVLFLAVFFFCGAVRAADKTEFGIEYGVVAAFKTGRPELIAKQVSYPLSRPRPVPAVKDAQDFIARFDMLFDEAFRTAIAHSTPQDWEIVGWRGTMFGAGDIWLDDDGKICALNTMTPKEKQYADELTQREINQMHASLRVFKKSEVVFDVALGHGRIDLIENPQKGADDFYRYAFWNKGKAVSEEPDVLIQDGTVDIQGSGGNTYYTFKNGNDTYRFEIIYVGNEDMLPHALVVLKDGVEIATYPAEVY